MKRDDAIVYSLGGGIILALVLIAPLLGAVFGSFAGFVLGLVFDDTMTKLAAIIGQPDMPAWQIGAILGIVGGFFRSSVSTSAK